MSAKRRSPGPLDPSTLEDLALAYVARYATTQARLLDYLGRKLRERGWSEGAGSDPQEALEALVARLAAAGYVDDMAWARMRAEGLLRRGYGARRVGLALRAAGVAPALLAADQTAEHLAGEAAQRRAALMFARRRGFGPFCPDRPDRARREKQIAAMLRAGHPLDTARRIVDADEQEDAEAWADSADGG